MQDLTHLLIWYSIIIRVIITCITFFIIVSIFLGRVGYIGAVVLRWKLQ